MSIIPLTLDRSNRITRQLAFSVLTAPPRLGVNINTAIPIHGTAIYPTQTGFAQAYIKYKGGPNIIGKTFTTTNANKQDYGISQVLVTSDGSFTGDLTLLVVANPAASAAHGWFFSQRNNTSGKQIDFAANYDGTGNSDSSGKFGLLCFAGSVQGSVSTASQVDGSTHVFVARRSGGTHTLWRDGVDVTGSVTNGSAAISDTSSVTCIGGLADVSQDNCANCTMPLVMGWNRALTQPEIMALGRDPTIIFLQPSQVVAPWLMISRPIGNLVYSRQAVNRAATW